MKRNLLTALLLGVCLVGGLAVAGVLEQGWKGITVAPEGQTGGTTIDRIECVNLAFTGDTSATATVSAIDSGASYFVTHGWQSSSADYGKVTIAISSTTLTATVAEATTGTLSVVIVQSPA
jgi:hypothetical protein